MKRILGLSLLLSLCTLTALAQEAGNRRYGNSGTEQGGDLVRRTPKYPEIVTEQVVSEPQNASGHRRLWS